MDRNQRIPFGKRGDKLITIGDLKENEYQRNCNCLCPECGQPLEAVNGEERKYFRHQKDHEHCHIVIDNYILEYTWQLLEALGVVEGLDITLDDVRFVKILPLLYNNIINENNGLNKDKENIKISKVNKTDRTFSIIIKDTEYKVKLIFKNKNKNINKDELIIDLSQIDGIKNIFSNEVKDNIVDNISSRISRDVFKMYKKDIPKKNKESVQIKDEINFIEEMYQDYVGQSKKIEILRYYDKKCPKCGAPLCEVKARIGTTIVCSNYPDCLTDAITLVSGKNK